MNKLIIRYSYNTVEYYFMALYNLELQLCYGFIKLRITVAYLESKVWSCKFLPQKWTSVECCRPAWMAYTEWRIKGHWPINSVRICSSQYACAYSGREWRWRGYCRWRRGGRWLCRCRWGDRCWLFGSWASYRRVAGWSTRSFPRPSPSPCPQWKGLRYCLSWWVQNLLNL